MTYARYKRSKGDSTKTESHRAAAERTGNLSRGQHATKAQWIIISPFGQQWRVFGMQQWCREHVHLFPGMQWGQVRSGLSSVQRGQCNQWRGWICRRHDIKTGY